MALDKEKVAQIAHLARIRVSDDECASYAQELSQILGWVEQLGELDTERVEPMTAAVDLSLPQRPDEITDGGQAEKVIANAPDAAEPFFAVPKVVE